MTVVHRHRFADSARAARTAVAGRGTRLLLAASLLAGCAWVVRRQTRRAEAANPPQGRLIDVDGVRLHVLERGDPGAPALVLLHGVGGSVRELGLSGLIGRAAVRYRVLAIDRPGHGHSGAQRRRDTHPRQQARLLLHALDALGVDQALVLGHSAGAQPAIAMALQAPGRVRGLVLVGGYYRPSLRLDALMALPPLLPLLGGLMRRTLSPLLGRALWPLGSWRVFSPREVTEPFRSDYPVWMALRPRALQANARESASMPRWAAEMAPRYASLKPPVVIVAGAGDRMVNTKWQAEWLHAQLPGSRLHVLADTGHMVHHVATHEVMKAIDEADKLAHAAWGAQQLRHWAHEAAASGASAAAAATP
jgi:pimeloyl-ACP methyl ester carboxylesterase